MRNKPETVHEYNIPRLNWWFLIVSAVFVGCFALMIWVDYSGGTLSWLGLRGDRQWKKYQRDFYELEKKRLADDANASEARAQEQGLDKLKADLKKATEQLAPKQNEVETLRAEASRLQIEASRVTRTFTMEKAMRDQYRSFYEGAVERNHGDLEAGEVKDWRDKVGEQNSTVTKWELRKQEADAKSAAAQAKVDKLVGEQTDLQKQITKLQASVKLLEKRLDQLDSTLVQTVVNAPVIEFAVPTIRVEQIQADGHNVDVNFTTVPRVDRCITCHKAIDRKPLAKDEVAWRAKHKIEFVDWSKQAQPLASHPNLDLFVGDTSPHPASKFGCTVCHWGWDRETDFSRASHSPDHEKKEPYTFDDAQHKWVHAPSADDEEDDSAGKAKPKVQTVAMTERDAWEKNYHWHHEEFNVQPMRQHEYVQASCLKCHLEQTSVRGAENLDHGRRLIEQLGCWSCHKMRQLESYSTHFVKTGETFEDICKLYDVNGDDLRRLNNLPAEVTLTVGRELTIPVRTLRKPGPSLYKVASKTDKDWVRKWLHNPVEFRPNTYMPRFWGLTNNKNDPARDDVEINALTEFLFAVSQPAPYPAPPVKGDATHGKELINSVGCLACHVIDESLMKIKPPAQLRKYMDEWEYRRYRSQGPQLAGSGSKMNQNWIYAWLKDPKQYHPGTKMPNLRLSDQEAADIAAFLGTLHNAHTDEQKLAAIDPNKLDAVTLEYLQVTLPQKQAQEKIHNLDDLVEAYFVDEATMKYYRDPAMMAREEAQLAAVRKEYDETFDDALQKKADKLEAALKDVKARMAAAKKVVAGLSVEQKQNVYLGSKLVSRYGCFACHNIRGFETAKPIGTELSEWGSKPLNKLDFGLLHLENSRIAWLKQKLHEPRAFDEGRVGVTRSPQEHLKMGKFNLTEGQIDQVVTVISGMTDEKLLASEPRQLSPAEFQMERGRWLVKELNCRGCHQVEGDGWAIRATGIPAGMEPPMLSGLPGQLRQGQRTQPDWLFHFLKAPQTGEVRPWLKVRMPTFGLSDSEANVLVRYFALEGHSEFPYETTKIDHNPEHLAAGKKIFTALQCAKCHIVEGMAKGKPLAQIPEEELPDLAPPLNLAYHRLQRDWLINKWLTDPGALAPGIRMPQFEYGSSIPSIKDVEGGDSLKQREALVDYIMSLGAQEEAPAPAPAAAPAETKAAK